MSSEKGRRTAALTARDDVRELPHCDPLEGRLVAADRAAYGHFGAANRIDRRDTNAPTNATELEQNLVQTARRRVFAG